MGATRRSTKSCKSSLSALLTTLTMSCLTLTTGLATSLYEGRGREEGRKGGGGGRRRRSRMRMRKRRGREGEVGGRRREGRGEEGNAPSSPYSPNSFRASSHPGCSTLREQRTRPSTGLDGCSITNTRQVRHRGNRNRCSSKWSCEVGRLEN